MIFISPKATVLQTIFNDNDKIVTELGIKGRVELPEIVLGTQVQLIKHYRTMVNDVPNEVLSAIDNSLKPLILVRANNYPMKYLYMPFEHIINLIAICSNHDDFEDWYELNFRRVYGHLLTYLEIFSEYNGDAYATDAEYNRRLQEYMEQTENIKKTTSPLDFHGYLTSVYNLPLEKYAASLSNLDINKLISWCERIQFNILMPDNQECQTFQKDNITVFPFIGGNS